MGPLPGSRTHLAEEVASVQLGRLVHLHLVFALLHVGKRASASAAVHGGSGAAVHQR